MALVKESKVDAAPAAIKTKGLVVNTAAETTSAKADSIEDDLPAYLAQDSCRLHAAAYRGNVKLMIQILKEDQARISSRRHVTCRAK